MPGSSEKPLNEMDATDFGERITVPYNLPGNVKEDIKILDKRTKDLRGISTELKKRKDYPRNDEIITVYEGVTVGEQVDFAKKLINRILAEKEIHSADQAINRTGERLRLAEEPLTPHEPDVFFKQILTQEKTSILEQVKTREKTKEVKTQELEMVLRLHNSLNPEDRTVVVCTVKHVNGVPQINEDENAIFLIMSQKEFDQESGRRRGDARAKWLRGELTNEGFAQAFKKEEGMSLAKAAEIYDAELANEPKHWTAEREKGGIIEKAENRFGKLLQTAQQEIEVIKEHTRELLDMEAERIKKIPQESDFSVFLDVLSSNMPQEKKDEYRRKLRAKFDINEEELVELLNKKKK